MARQGVGCWGGAYHPADSGAAQEPPWGDRIWLALSFRERDCKGPSPASEAFPLAGFLKGCSCSWGALTLGLSHGPALGSAKPSGPGQAKSTTERLHSPAHPPSCQPSAPQGLSPRPGARGHRHSAESSHPAPHTRSHLIPSGSHFDFFPSNPRSQARGHALESTR